jgi:hypothetical protein
MKRVRIIIAWLHVSIIVITPLPAQEQKEGSKKLEVNGYFTSMQSVMDMDSLEGRWITDYRLTNRLNFYFYPTESLVFSLQERTRFIYGDPIRNDISGIYKKTMASDDGWMDLTFNLFDGNSYVFNLNIDRLWVKYTVSKLEITIGRQRINWGQTYVWNPNDIFNAYSFFDFDYEERPGSDAVRLQYYTGPASCAEVAVKADSSKKITAAGLFRLNKWGYDIQLLGGVLNSEDLVAGLGWSGDIAGAGFKGEVSYFHPYRNIADTTGLLFLSVGADYTFKNSLYIGFEGLYSPLPVNSEMNFAQFYSEPLTVKNLSFAEYNLFLQVSYPITPILNASFAGMYFPDISGYYLGPSCTYSLQDNLDFSVYLQFFKGKFPDITGSKVSQSFSLGFMRLKYSF